MFWDLVVVCRMCSGSWLHEYDPFQHEWEGEKRKEGQDLELNFLYNIIILGDWKL